MFFLLEKHDKSGVIVNLLRGVEKANPRGMSQSYRQTKTIELPPFRGEKLLKSTTEVWEICPSCFPAFENLPFVIWQKLNGHWADHDYDYNFLFFLLSYILHFPIISWFWHSILQHAQGNVFWQSQTEASLRSAHFICKRHCHSFPKNVLRAATSGKTHIYIFIYIYIYMTGWIPNCHCSIPADVHEISTNHA